MKSFASLILVALIALSGTSGVVAQLSPSIADLEKERLRKAKEEDPLKITVGDVASASAARKSDRVLGYDAECAAKKAVACFELGNHLRSKNGKTPQDAVDEMTAYGLACQLNHAEGCNKFGGIKEKGQGLRLERDPMMALNAYGRACKLGFSDGCYNGATLLSSGKSSDPVLQAKQAQAAQSLYRAGCDLGHYYACKTIGIAPPDAAPTVVAGDR